MCRSTNCSAPAKPCSWMTAGSAKNNSKEQHVQQGLDLQADCQPSLTCLSSKPPGLHCEREWRGKSMSKNRMTIPIQVKAIQPLLFSIIEFV